VGRKKQRTRREHFVPQSYLIRFSPDGSHIWVFDKFQQRSFQASIRDVAQEAFFYDYPAGTRAASNPNELIDTQQVEKALATIENGFSPLLADIIRRVENQGLSTSDIERLAQHVSLQWMRTKEYRECALAIAQQSLQVVSDDLVRRHFPDAKREDYPKVSLDEAYHAAVHNDHFFTERAVCTIAWYLSDYFWIVGIAPEGQSLYSSDNPVVRRANRWAGDVPLLGVDDPGVEFAFPMSPRHLLMILERQHFASLAKYDGKTMPLSDRQVADYNRLQVWKSFRQVFAKCDDFTLAREACCERPDVCQPDRVRAVVEMVEIEPLKSELMVRVVD
jgi:uncharacterized protein DUF4238